MTLPLLNESLLKLTAMTMRAPSARQTETGTGLTRAPSISQRPLILHRAEDAGQRERRLKRIHQAAFVEPDLMAGAELGGDRHEFPLQPLDGDVAANGSRDGCSGAVR